MKELTREDIKQEIATAETELLEPDKRGIRLYERIKIKPDLWAQEQYPDNKKFWVIALMGTRCLYFNHVEGGWGWGQYSKWGEISGYHWQNLEIYHLIFQTLFAIDEGGNG